MDIESQKRGSKSNTITEITSHQTTSNSNPKTVSTDCIATNTSSDKEKEKKRYWF